MRATAPLAVQPPEQDHMALCVANTIFICPRLVAAIVPPLPWFGVEIEPDASTIRVHSPSHLATSPPGLLLGTWWWWW